MSLNLLGPPFAGTTNRVFSRCRIDKEMVSPRDFAVKPLLSFSDSIGAEDTNGHLDKPVIPAKSGIQTLYLTGLPP